VTGRERVRFYGIASNGKARYAEQLITFPAGKMTAEWTGVTYRTVKDAQTAIAAKNLQITQELYA
jgi:hypothetical protein